MPNFKPKAKKKLAKKSKSSITLDNKHNEKMTLFNKQHVFLIPQLKNEKLDIIKKLKKIVDITKRLELKDRLIEIKNEINKLKHQKKEYLLTNSKYIFDYFEKKKKYF